MAKVSNSAPFIATDLNEANAVAERFRDYIASPLLTQIRIKTEGFEAYDVTPSSIPDVFVSRPLLIFGKYKGTAKGKLIITGNQGSGTFKNEYNIADATLSKNNKALRYLWARKKIEHLGDYSQLFGDNTKQQVINLGLQYNLLTQYTSFVAVDNEVVNKNGNRQVVKQPLPMPKNVSSSAVGAEASVKGKTIIGKRKSKTAQYKKAEAWFKLNFKAEIKKLLNTYDGIRVTLNTKGDVVKIEVLNKGLWQTKTVLLQHFKTLTEAEALPLKAVTTLTIRS